MGLVGRARTRRCLPPSFARDNTSQMLHNSSTHEQLLFCDIVTLPLVKMLAPFGPVNPPSCSRSRSRSPRPLRATGECRDGRCTSCTVTWRRADWQAGAEKMEKTEKTAQHLGRGIDHFALLTFRRHAISCRRQEQPPIGLAQQRYQPWPRAFEGTLLA